MTSTIRRFELSDRQYEPRSGTTSMLSPENVEIMKRHGDADNAHKKFARARAAI